MSKIKIKSGDVALTAWAGIDPESLSKRIVEILLRDEDNLTKINSNNELYTDLQLEEWIAPNYDFPVGVTTGRVLLADWWVATWSVLCFKSTSWDYVLLLYWDNGKLYIDNGTGTFTQIYLKPEVDALFTQLRSEISAVWFSGEYADLLHKPTLWTASALDVWTDPWEIPVVQQNGRLDPSIVPNVTSHTFTVADVADLTTLSQANQWDMAIVTNASSTYILSAEPYSTLANWTLLPTPTSDVTSVNWQRWDVQLTTNDVPEANNKLYTTVLEKQTWNNKVGTNDLAQVAFSGEYSDIHHTPTIGNATLTIKKNNVAMGSPFPANATVNAEINIPVPTTVAELSDATDYAKKAELEKNIYLTQAQYDALPSTKESDWNSYFIYETQ